MNKIKAIQCSVILTNVRDRADNSAGLSLSTPELTNDEFNAFRDMKNMELEVLFQPVSINGSDTLTIDKDAGGKSHSERLRNTLFVYWKQKGERGDFNNFYASKMENLINMIKEKLI